MNTNPANPVNPVKKISAPLRLALLSLALLSALPTGSADLVTDELLVYQLQTRLIAPLPQNTGVNTATSLILSGKLGILSEGVLREGIPFLPPCGDVPMGAFTNRPGDPPSPHDPTWWAARKVIAPTAAQNDYAPATQGQVKWIASQAAAELNASAVGTDPAVSTLVSGFSQAGSDLPVTLGQLKNTAWPFWEKLITEGYTNRCPCYPWLNNALDDFALANVGQVKNLFAFDLHVNRWWDDWFGAGVPVDPHADSNGDGFSNFLEMQMNRNPVFSVSAVATAENGSFISWTPVDGATSYTIIVGAFTTTVAATSTSLMLTNNFGYNYAMTVKANGTGNDSRFTVNTSASGSSYSGLIAIKLFDPFTAGLMPGTSTVYSQTFAINRRNGWQQYYISSYPDYIDHGWLEGMHLEWSDSGGRSGIVTNNDWYSGARLPLSVNSPTHLTLTLVAESRRVVSHTPLYLIVWSPPVSFGESAASLDTSSGEEIFFAQTSGGSVPIEFTIDTSGRPSTQYLTYSEPITYEEIDSLECPFMERPDGLSVFWTPWGQTPWISYPSGSVVLGSGIYALAAGVSIPVPEYNLPQPPGPPLPPTQNNPLPAATLYVISPQVSVDKANGAYGSSNSEWPLDECVENAYYSHRWEKSGDITLRVSLFTNHFDYIPGCFEVYIDGKKRSSCTFTHDDQCGRTNVQVQVQAGSWDWEKKVNVQSYYYDNSETSSGARVVLDGGCCDSGCDSGSCDGIDGASLGSVRFRVALGAPASGRIAGFLSLNLQSDPNPVTFSDLLITGGPDVAAVTNENAITIRCTSNLGRTLSVSNVVNGVNGAYGNGIGIWVTDADGTLDSRWEITGGIRIRRFTRSGNLRTDETYYNSSNLEWRRVDNLSDTTEALLRNGDTEIRSLYEGYNNEGPLLSCISNVLETVGEDSDIPRRRIRERHEWDGANGWLSTYSTYHDAPDVPFLHGALRSRWGDKAPWEYHAYDTDGCEILRAVQLDGSLPPAWLDDPEDNPSSRQALVVKLAASSATITEYDYSPLPGDSNRLGDANSPRIIFTYVVQAGEVIPVSQETHIYSLGEDTQGRSILITESTRGFLNGESIATASLAYNPDNVNVPEALRGLPLYEESEDGTIQEWVYELGDYAPATRTFKPGDGTNFLRSATLTRLRDDLPGIPPSSADAPPFVSVEVTDAAFGRTLLSATYLSDTGSLGATPTAALNGATPLSWEASAYDLKGRLRSTLRSDGTSSTNDYSCCRLLYSTGFDGTKTLRSAVTGYDHLYHAIEEVSLADLPGANGDYRVTQYFSDALGRVTNTTVFTGNVPGAFTDKALTGGSPLTTLTEYPLGSSSYRITTAPSGIQTTTTVTRAQWGDTTVTETGNYKLTTQNYHNGPSVTERVWDNCWTRDTRETVWDMTTGLRTDIQTHEASDIAGTVTNAITRYDALGRVATVETPTGITSNLYANGTTLLLQSELSDPSKNYKLTTKNLYDSSGSPVGTEDSEGLSSLTLTGYEEINNDWWQVTAQIMTAASLPSGSSSLTTSVTRARMTGLDVTAATYFNDPANQQLLTLNDPLLTDLSSSASARLTAQSEALDGNGTLLSRETAFLDPSTCTAWTLTESPMWTTAALAVSVCGYPVTNTGPSGAATSYTYDGLGNLLSVTNQFLTPNSSLLTSSTSYAYDPLGNILSVTNQFLTPNSSLLTSSTSYAYDPFGRKTQEDVFDADNDKLTTKNYLYDSMGNLTNAWGSTYPVSYTYDTAGRMTSMTTADKNHFSVEDWFCFGYGGQFATASITTHWHYDPVSGLLANKVYADGSGIAYAYDGIGRLTSRTSARGIVTAYTYNNRSQILTTTYSDATPDVDYEYDAFGRMASATSPLLKGGGVGVAGGLHASVTYEYDGLYLTSETQNGKRIERDYDAFGRPQSVTLFSNHLPLTTNNYASYTYDGAGRLASVQGGADIPVCQTDYQYDEFGRVTQRETSNPSNNYKLTTKNSYDPLGNILSVTNHFLTPTSSLLTSSFDYDYDALNRRTKVAQAFLPVGGASTNTFAYNSRSELTNAVFAGYPYDYWYDPIGNFWIGTEGGDTGRYHYLNALNQPTDIYHFDYSGDLFDWQQYTTFFSTHDADGNMTFDGNFHYEWDAENRLVSATSPLTSISYAYDHLGRRIRKTVLDTSNWKLETRNFSYDGWNLMSETTITNAFAPNTVPPDITALLNSTDPTHWAEIQGGALKVYDVTVMEPGWYLYHSAFYGYDMYSGNLVLLPETFDRLYAATSAGTAPPPYPWMLPTTYSAILLLDPGWIYNGNLFYYGHAYSDDGSTVTIGFYVESVAPGSSWRVFLTPYENGWVYDLNFALNPDGSMPDFLPLDPGVPDATASIQYVPSTTTNVTTYPLLSCGTNITRYVWGLDISGQSGGRASSQAEMQGAGGVGGLCAVFPDNGITPHYPAYDANGNITEYVDFIGNTIAHYEYDAFGNTVNKSGSMADDFKHRFSTKYLDVETGLYNYGLRPYSPPLQRFISRDPIGERGGLNLYGFCGNDPVNYVDVAGQYRYSPLPGTGVYYDTEATPPKKDEDTFGPDVTLEVERVLADISYTYSKKWSLGQKCKACKDLFSDDGWDIHPLTGWGKYGYTVQFKGKGYHAGAVNYVMWGRANKLCYGTFRLPAHSLPVALVVLDAWKILNYGGAQGSEAEAFAIYGYTGYLPFIRTLPIPWIGRPWTANPPPQQALPQFSWTWKPNQ